MYEILANSGRDVSDEFDETDVVPPSWGGGSYPTIIVAGLVCSSDGEGVLDG
jgi:hypothetical protein